MDYRKLDENQQRVVELSLVTEGLHGKLFNQVEKGEVCAMCLLPHYNCICHDEE